MNSMEKKTIDLTKILDSEGAGRIAERLEGTLSDAEETVWGGDFAASGEEKAPPPMPVPVPAE